MDDQDQKGQGVKPENYDRAAIFWIAATVVTFFCAVAYGVTTDPLTEQEKKCRGDGTLEGAYEAAQEKVMEHLKSPSTAVFPEIGERRVNIQQTEDCHFHISSYVDSQNGFGAVGRTRWKIELEHWFDDTYSRPNGSIAPPEFSDW